MDTEKLKGAKVVVIGAGHHHTAETKALIRAVENDREIIIVGVDEAKEMGIDTSPFAPPSIPIKIIPRPEFTELYEPFVDEEKLYGTKQKKHRKGVNNRKTHIRKPKSKKTHRKKRK